MQNLKKFLLFTIFFLPSSFFAFSFEPIPTNELLLSYLENDITLKKNLLDTQKAKLSLDSTKIDNGFDISLSTGNITIKPNPNSSSDNILITAKPSIKATLPQAANLKFSVSSDLNFGESINSDSKSSSTASASTLQNTKISTSIDLLSANKLQQEINFLKAERTLTESKRKLQNQAINAEKTFYSELKSLLTATDSLLTLEKNLYSSKIDLEKIKAQGYSANSSTYRLTNMKVISGEHDIENAKHSLIHSYIMFYKKCGYEINLKNNDYNTFDFYTLIPTDILEVQTIDIHNFNAELYSETENALWVNKINTMQRTANSKLAKLTLSANGGVTLNNSNSSSTTIDAGLSSSFGGVGVDADVNFPITSSPTPIISFSASITPNTFKKNKINIQQNELTEQQELIEIETARTNYETKIIDYEQNLTNLIWSKKLNNESYEMYASLEKDMAKWYEQGVITESEYYSAKVNAQSYYVKNIINKIDFIIYNDNIKTMFIEE